jgi:hypothetical protein
VVMILKRIVERKAVIASAAWSRFRGSRTPAALPVRRRCRCFLPARA